MTQTIDADTQGLLLIAVRLMRGWSQVEMAEAGKVDPSSLLRYENGKLAPRKKLEQILAGASLPIELAEATLVPAFQAARASVTPFTAELFADLEPALADLAQALAATDRSAINSLLAELDPAYDEPWERADHSAMEDRQRAARLWSRLAPLTAAERLFLVERHREFHLASLAELLAEEGEKAAATSPAEAMELAKLAGRVRELQHFSAGLRIPP
ncbi:MAG TPA: helix-turn-helix transcriptional regulator [Thermoanaerobaculia bacterium]|jgi:transcriptional regulator with XRE-family HTH domain|nr:helix-turn-helix transcriptional regulator [Thermoanaerobaculia bacterium]